MTDHVLVRWIQEPIAVLAFWSSLVVPVGYLLVFLDGIGSVSRLALLGSIIGIHILLLIGGRHYHTETE